MVYVALYRGTKRVQGGLGLRNHDQESNGHENAKLYGNWSYHKGPGNLKAKLPHCG